MKNVLIGLLLSVSSIMYAQYGEKNFIDQNFIEVTGKSEMEVAPDEIYLKILINEKDFKNKKLDDIEKSMIEKLKEIGVNVTEDLSIKDFLSNFKNYWIIKSDILLSKEYQLLLHDAKTAGRVFTEFEKIGISNISIEKIDNSKIVDYRKEVKINAIKAAHEKAKALAMAINQDIGRALYIQEQENNLYTPLQGKAAGIQFRGISNTIAYGVTNQEPDMEFEKIKLEYAILVRFELK